MRKAFILVCILCTALNVTAQWSGWGGGGVSNPNDLITLDNGNLGAPAVTPTQLADLAGNALPLHLSQTFLAFSAPMYSAITLDDATGDEYALSLIYTVDKAAGNDFGLRIDMTDTVSPGTSKPFSIWVNGAEKFSVSQTGSTVIGSGLTTNGTNIFGTTYTTTWGARFGIGPSSIAIADGYNLTWSSTAQYSGARDIELSRYNDGSNTYLCVGDGDISGCDGRLQAGAVAVGSYAMFLPDSSSRITLRNLDNTAYFSLWAKDLFALGGGRLGFGTANYFGNATTNQVDLYTNSTLAMSIEADQDVVIAGALQTSGGNFTVDTSGNATAAGQVIGDGCYGELYYDGAGATITVTTAGNYYGFTDFVQGNVSGSPYVTADVADASSDHLIIGASGAGVYFVAISGSWDSAAATSGSCYLFDSATGIAGVGFAISSTAASQNVGGSGSGIVVAGVGDEFNVRCTATKDSDFLRFKALNLSIYRLN